MKRIIFGVLVGVSGTMGYAVYYIYKHDENLRQKLKNDIADLVNLWAHGPEEE